MLFNIKTLFLGALASSVAVNAAPQAQGYGGDDWSNWGNGQDWGSSVCSSKSQTSYSTGTSTQTTTATSLIPKTTTITTVIPKVITSTVLSTIVFTKYITATSSSTSIATSTSTSTSLVTGITKIPFTSSTVIVATQCSTKSAWGYN